MKSIFLLTSLAFAAVMISGCSSTEEVIGTDSKHSVSVTYKDVRPIFRENCALVGCHLGEGAPHGLRLDTFDHILTGSFHGAVVVAGSPQEGEMMYRLTGIITPAMPPPKRLDPARVELLRLWIIDGLKRD